MKSLKINVSDEMADYLSSCEINDYVEFKRAALLLYAYIDSGIITYEKAADLLGVGKYDLKDYYDSYGLPYITQKDIKRYADAENRLLSFYAAKLKEGNKV